MRFRLLMLVLAGVAFISFMNGSSKPSDGLKVGDKAPVIQAFLPDGTKFNSDSLHGKMILIDFWASYDAPSRIDNFRKISLFERYKNSEFFNSDGFVIVSVSLDRFKAPFFGTIERDELFSFFHICDFKGKESDLVQAFGISDVMVNYLVDGDGRILEVSDDLDKIESVLQRLESLDQTRFAHHRRQLNLNGL